MDYLKYDTSEIMYNNEDMSYAEAFELGRERLEREDDSIARITQEEYQEVYGY